MKNISRIHQASQNCFSTDTLSCSSILHIKSCFIWNDRNYTTLLLRIRLQSGTEKMGPFKVSVPRGSVAPKSY